MLIQLIGTPDAKKLRTVPVLEDITSSFPRRTYASPSCWNLVTSEYDYSSEIEAARLMIMTVVTPELCVRPSIPLITGLILS